MIEDICPREKAEAALARKGMKDCTLKVVHRQRARTYGTGSYWLRQWGVFRNGACVGTFHVTNSKHQALHLWPLLGEEVKIEEEDQTTNLPPPGTFWDLFAEVSGSLMDEDVARLPKDGARQHDHYIYGTKKREETEE